VARFVGRTPGRAIPPAPPRPRLPAGDPAERRLHQAPASIRGSGRYALTRGRRWTRSAPESRPRHATVGENLARYARRAVRASALPAQSLDCSPRTHGAQPVAVCGSILPDCSPRTAGPQPRDVLRLALRPGWRAWEGAIEAPSQFIGAWMMPAEDSSANAAGVVAEQAGQHRARVLADPVGGRTTRVDGLAIDVIGAGGHADGARAPGEAPAGRNARPPPCAPRRSARVGGAPARTGCGPRRAALEPRPRS